MNYSVKKWPFESDIPGGSFQRFLAYGFENSVCGIIFEGGEALSGVPLGGLGTGYIELLSDGTLGRCSIFNDICPPRELKLPFLGLTVDKEVYLLTNKPSGRIKGVKGIRYFGHFPIVDMQFDLECPVQVALRAFTPFILGDSKTSNTPLVLFSIRLTNVSNKRVKGKFAFSFPGPKEGEPFKHSVFSERNISGISVTQRRGAGYTLGVLGKEKTHWGAMLGSRKNPWENLLKEEIALPDESEAGTTLIVDYILNCGQVKEIHFLLGWFYPYFKDSGGEPHTHHYFRQFRNSEKVVKFGAQYFNELSKRVLTWQKVIYDSDEPDWLKDALINCLYSLAKNTLWVVNNRPDNWYPPVGFFTHSESFTGCPITETMVCRIHGHFPTLFFFPELEYSTLYAFKHFQISDGEIPFCFGRPTSLRDPRYHCQHPLNSGQYAQMIYRYFKRTKDKEFLSQFYSSAKKAINYQKSLDYDNDGLVNEHSHAEPGEYWPANQFYDIWPWFGTSAYVAGTWLGTLTSGIALAEAVGDKKSSLQWKEWLRRGKNSYEKKLWNGSYFRLYNDSENHRIRETSLANQLMGVWCAKILGLESPLSEEKVKKALSSIKRLNFKVTRYGLVNGVHPNGSKDFTREEENDHGKQIFVGESLCAAMTFMYYGEVEVGMEIARRLYEVMVILSRSPWNQYCLISSEDGHPVWGEDYYSNMVFWALPMARKGEDIASFVSEKGLVGKILKAGE